ncbi:MAG: hypothetical protein RLZZ352_2741 [Pseudomonadota bacterium]|jgi:hypothetical protein
MKLGSPATGKDFWGREQALAAIWQYLEKEHLILPGVRRLGKSSVLLRMQEQASEHGVVAKVLDVSMLQSAEAFIQHLNAEFTDQGITAYIKKHQKKVTEWFSRLDSVALTLPDALGGGGAEIQLSPHAPAHWQASAHTLQQRLQTQPLLILLDEFPVMLQNLLKTAPHEAEQLLVWLRTWRQNRGNRCRFVFTGSIGLQNLLERHGLAVHMNDCYAYVLGPFSNAEASAMWQAFAKEHHGGLSSHPTVTAHALQRIGWLAPFYVCLLLDESGKAAKVRMDETPHAAPHALTTDDIDAAYETLLTLRGRFHHWEQRLRQALPTTEFDFAQALLTHLAKSNSGLTLKQLNNRLAKQQADTNRRAEQLQNALAYLTDEGYTTPVNAEGRVQFRSFLLRDWWSRNHV